MSHTLASLPTHSLSFQVRVGNLQELVYKQGQAGVTKATVTIVFNNADPATSPGEPPMRRRKLYTAAYLTPSLHHPSTLPPP